MNQKGKIIFIIQKTYIHEQINKSQMTSGRIFGPSEPQRQHLYGGVSHIRSTVCASRTLIKTKERLRLYRPTEQRPDFVTGLLFCGAYQRQREGLSLS